MQDRQDIKIMSVVGMNPHSRLEHICPLELSLEETNLLKRIYFTIGLMQ